MDQLTIQEKVGANYMLLELAGAINAYTITEFQEKLDRYLLDTYVVIDLERVSGMDSAGLGVILAGINSGEEYGTRLFVMNPSDVARHALERTGFWDSFNIIHSVTEVANA